MIATLRGLRSSGRLDLPFPGSGDTPLRHRALVEMARTSPVGVGRLIEAHCDALAILDEAGRMPIDRALYGVWASAGPDGPVLEDGHLTGVKSFCSGLGLVDRALVTVTAADGSPVLIDVAVDAVDGRSTVIHDTSAWSTSALADTATGSIRFEEYPVDDRRVLGGTDWYLQRAGFWHGACGPAACWIGATLGIVDAAAAGMGADPHQQAQVGAMQAASWGLQALLDAAGDEIDADPDDRVAAERRARSLRHLAERICSDVLDRFGRAFGPRPFTTDADIAARFADTQLYLRQHHGERELPALAAVAGQWTDASVGEPAVESTGPVSR